MDYEGGKKMKGGMLRGNSEGNESEMSPQRITRKCDKSYES